MESRAFANPDLWKIFTWCLMKANHKKKWMAIRTGSGQTEVEVERGEFVFGRHTAAKELKLKPSTVWNRMLKLQKYGNIKINSTKYYSIITIINFEKYN